MFPLGLKKKQFAKEMNQYVAGFIFIWEYGPGIRQTCFQVMILLVPV